MYFRNFFKTTAALSLCAALTLSAASYTEAATAKISATDIPVYEKTSDAAITPDSASAASDSTSDTGNDVKCEADSLLLYDETGTETGETQNSETQSVEISPDEGSSGETSSSETSSSEASYNEAQNSETADDDSYYSYVPDREKYDGYYIIKVSADSISSLQTYLNEAKENATVSLPYKIVVEPGAYVLSKRLCIYSNTFLYMDGVTFTQKSGASTNLLKVGDASDTNTGYYYENITLYGGVWDENGNGNTAIKVAHAASFTMTNQTVQNVVNGHLMEIAGVKKLTIQNCTFQNQTLTSDADSSKMTYEAIQIDILVKDHMSGYAYEVLQNQQITIDGCTFDNVPRGIGSHTAILNSPADHVTITNNTFSNTTSGAIHVMNYQNLTISGNTMTNVPRGIAVYAMRPDGTYLPSTISSDTLLTSSYLTPAANQNIVITDNTISCSGSDQYLNYEDCGILLSGFNNISPLEPSYGDTLPVGNYYISGAVISGNTISAGYGIIADDAQNTSITSNTLTFSGDTSASYRGVTLRNLCSNVTVSQNKVSLFPENGIYLINDSNITVSKNELTTAGNGILLQGTTNSDITSNTLACQAASNSYAAILLSGSSTANQISSNRISDSAGTAISIQDSSQASAVTGNTISSAGYCGIYVENAAVTKINKNTLTNTCSYNMDNTSFGAISVCSLAVVGSILNNTITSPQTYGIMVNEGEAKKISGNTVTGAQNYGILVYNNANVTTISKNTVTSGSTIGIHIADTSSAVKVTGNTVSGCKTAQIYVNRSSGTKAVTITNNTVTGTSKLDGIRVDLGKVTLQTNKIKSCRYAILLCDKAKATVYKNTYSSNKYNATRIWTETTAKSTAYKNLAKPTSLKATAVSKSQIQLSWKKVSKATGYRIYRSTKKKQRI